MDQSIIVLLMKCLYKKWLKGGLGTCYSDGFANYSLEFIHYSSHSHSNLFLYVHVYRKSVDERADVLLIKYRYD